MAIFKGTVEQIENNKNKVSRIEGASEKQYPNCKAVEDYVGEQVGDIETALDSIIAIQNSLMGGDNV